MGASYGRLLARKRRMHAQALCMRASNIGWAFHAQAGWLGPHPALGLLHVATELGRTAAAEHVGRRGRDRVLARARMQHEVARAAGATAVERIVRCARRQACARRLGLRVTPKLTV